ncbi:virulence factor TspB C-terminal domain-related protein [Methylobacillus sp. Pita2]|uniref:virulence factor TspB C-terminal domain-related protein n=1 Tax=Methylobacillus sp. Pita2 TaxID=3383245 RepID=UPI0038B47070
MDIVQRVIFGWLIPALAYVLLFMFVGLMSNEAFADEYDAHKKYRINGVDRDTAEEICEFSLVSSGYTYSRVVHVSSTSAQCFGFYPPPNNQEFQYQYSAQAVYSCPYGGELRTSRTPPYCFNPPACPEGQTRQPNGSCAAPPVQCEPGCNGVCGTEQALTNRGTLACFNGCYYGLGDAWGIVISNGKKTWWTDVEDNTGVPCDAPEDEQPDGAEDAPDPAETPDPCPECECAKKGMTWGSYTTNGTTTVMCLKPGTPGGKPVDVAPKPTVKTETPAPTPDNPNPEPTTTVTPSPVITITPGSGAGSQPTVTETTTNPDGSTTSTSEPQESYCQKNPNAQLCKEADKENEKGSWGGGCGSWECDGDAANCAMARKIHQDRCDDIEGMQQFENAATQGQRLLHGESDEDVTAYLNREGDGNRTINVGSLVSDSGPYSFGASCISDVQFSIGGHSVSVPFSKICPYLEMIGYFLLAAAYLAALRIVGLI